MINLKQIRINLKGISFLVKKMMKLKNLLKFNIN